MSLSRAVAAAAVVVVLPVSGAAAAGANEEVRAQKIVRSVDLDLSSRRDAARLLRRIETAALQVCGAGPTSLSPVKQAIRRSPCFADAVATAVDRLKSPEVNLAYERSRPRAKPVAANGGEQE